MDLRQQIFLLTLLSWSANQLVTPGVKYSTCGTYFIGGYNILGATGSGSNAQMNDYFERTYLGLPPHSSIQFSFRIAVIDSLDGNDYYEFHFDSNVITSWKIPYGHYNTNVCGTPGYEDVVDVKMYGQVPHSGPKLVFQLVMKLDEGSINESIGIRNIVFLFSTQTVAANSFCATSSTLPLSTATPPSACACSEGQYSNGGVCTGCNPLCSNCYGPLASDCTECKPIVAFFDGTQCVACTYPCATCFGSSPKQCYTCASGYIAQGSLCIACSFPLVITPSSTCTLPCSNSGEFLDPSTSPGTCSLTCEFPYNAGALLTALGPIRTCTPPTCPTAGQYVYWDSVCRIGCVSPLQLQTISGILVCTFPCADPTSVVYWDGSCQNSCPFPLVYQINYDKSFCTYPCAAASQTLYNNGSCLSSCQTYYVSWTYIGMPMCSYPCLSTEYLYSNGSCLSKCQTHFTQFTLDILADDHFCYYPCLASQFLYNNGSCLSTCDFRFISLTLTGEQYCDYPCLSTEYLYLNGSCLASCRPYFNAWFDTVTSDMYCDNPCASAAPYLYNNGTCSATCATYFKSYTQGTDRSCHYPCQPDQYLYSNGSCLLYCAPHFIPKTYTNDHFCSYPCASGLYLYYNGSCLSTCIWPLISTAAGADQFCNYPCNTGDYLYSNGTCLAECPSTFTSQSHGSENYCMYPCSAGEYLYGNGSCLGHCEPGFIPRMYGSNLFCDFVCEPDKYLYDNSSCLSSCDVPFISTVLDDNKYCHHPCGDPSIFIYWNSTCRSKCPLPYTASTDGVNLFCLYPCSSDQFLYWNESCQSECGSPLIAVTQNDLDYCTYPCSTGQLLLWNGSCVTSCPLPYRIKDQFTGPLCILPCDSPDEYYYEDSGLCLSECDLIPVVENLIFRKCLDNQQQSETGIISLLSTSRSKHNGVTFIILSPTIQHIRYLNITYPSRVQSLLFAEGRPPLSLRYGYMISEKPTLNTNREYLPALFTRFGYSSLFLVNFWNDLIFLGALLLTVILLAVFAKVCENIKWDEWKMFFDRMKVIFKWNLIIMFLAVCSRDIILYSSFEFKTSNLSSMTDTISLLLCICVNLIIVTILIGSYFCVTLSKSVKIHVMGTRSFGPYSHLLHRLADFQVTFRGFHTHSLARALFYPIYIARIILPMIIASYLYISPLTQTILYMLCSIAFLSYLIYLKPIKKQINYIQILILELLVLTVNTSILGLTAIDVLQIQRIATRIFFGDIIIVCNFAINILAVVFLVIKVVLVVRTISNPGDVKLEKERKKMMILQLLFLPLQQAAFGFEQVQIPSFSRQQAKSNQLTFSSKHEGPLYVQDLTSHRPLKTYSTTVLPIEVLFSYY